MTGLRLATVLALLLACIFSLCLATACGPSIRQPEAGQVRLALATDRVGQSLWETQRRTLQNVDPNDDAELEEAILRYGCFVLCQRGPLQGAVDMPESREPFRHQWAVALGLTGIFIFLISRPNKKRSSQGLFAN